MKIRYLLVFLLFIAPVHAIEIDSCQTLNVADTIYELNQSVSSSGTCFTIGANNVTLDGAGYTVNYSQSSVGYGILNTGGYDSLTIKNLNIVQDNSSLEWPYAIYSSGMIDSVIKNNTITTLGTRAGIYIKSNSDSNNITNNTITTFGNYGYGIQLFSDDDSNNIINNTITTFGNYGYGIVVHSSTSNIFNNNNITVTNGLSITLESSSNSNNLTNNILNTNIRMEQCEGNNIINGSVNGYKFYDSVTNNFTNTNFTVSRQIYFSDITSWFNYNNETDGNVWLKTKINVANKFLDRTLTNWSYNLMTWNDTANVVLTASYNLTGLITGANYNVTNSTASTSNSQIIQTDASGKLTVDIFLSQNINTEIKVELLVPTYSDNLTNSTEAGTDILHSLKWEAYNNLSGYISSFDNGTGSFINDSWVSITGIINWSNFTKIVNSTLGSTIRWKVYVNDTLNNLTESDNYSYITTDTVAPVLHTQVLTPTDGIVNIVFNVKINVTELNNMDYVEVKIIDPQGASITYNMTLDANTSTEYQYSKNIIPTTVGLHDFEFYAFDETGNNHTFIGILDYPSSASSPGGGGAPGPAPSPGISAMCGNGICEYGENAQNCPGDCLPEGFNMSELEMSPEYISDFALPGWELTRTITILNKNPFEIDVDLKFLCLTNDKSCEWIRLSTNEITIPAGTPKNPGLVEFDLIVKLPDYVDSSITYTYNIILEYGGISKVVPYKVKTLISTNPIVFLKTITEKPMILLDGTLVKFDKRLPILGDGLTVVHLLVILIIAGISLYFYTKGEKDD